ncbi:amidohydrolase family protein [Pseudochryseolinea flava]|uniref:Amidohydrolase-related domain-containing protein n=1 Tax=Pseudochryseolinea flava TaxID=2059302 RepID=A0A364Y8N2_9BACT|nr:amidohydrolase family protein [Pseudochryseolinea flava]RAW02210.1 hypothetical protein DQQ10_06620 [Pseudochryseolinea flava]
MNIRNNSQYKHGLTLYFVILLFASLSVSAQQVKTAIEHVNVIPLTENVIVPDQTVLIENGTIKAIGKNIVIPKGYHKIDGTNKYLTPGYADMHAHLPGHQSQPYSEERYFLLNLLNGVTTLRGMRGHPSQLEMRKNALLSKKQAPTIYVSSPPITKQDKSLSVDNGEATFRDYMNQGYDFIKILSIDTVLYDQLMPMFTKNKWAVVGHAPDGKLSRAIRSGQKGIEHIEPFVNSYEQDSALTFKLFSEMHQRGVSHCPDVFWYSVFGYQRTLEELQATSGMEYVRPIMKQAWVEKWQQRLNTTTNLEAQRTTTAARIATYLNLISKINKAGVLLLISPGDGEFIIPGFGFHEEMKIFAQAGIKPYDILRAATVNAATSLGQSSQWGTVEVGKHADLVLLSQNPLTNIENANKIEGVMVKGTWITRVDIEKSLQTAP